MSEQWKISVCLNGNRYVFIPYLHRKLKGHCFTLVKDVNVMIFGLFFMPEDRFNDTVRRHEIGITTGENKAKWKGFIRERT
ncbi:hypothetical protein GCM10008967_38270 [Bacillus carboniphilus]|uniref:Uncharacterized protein n=1 Tax=Bacillus carboniphilus TaxID=86663 RepID=A0ABN0WQW4_9BACI